jgi:hypothetical protein
MTDMPLNSKCNAVLNEIAQAKLDQSQSKCGGDDFLKYGR